MRSCERPRKRSASEALPSSVSNRYSLSIRTHGSSCRRRASSSLRRVSFFSSLSSSSRAASHSARDTTLGWFIWFFSVLVFILHSICLGFRVDVLGSVLGSKLLHDQPSRCATPFHGIGTSRPVCTTGAPLPTC